MPTPAWNLARLLEQAFEPLFNFFVYLIVLLPSGTVLHINVKILLFVALTPAALHRMLRGARFTWLHLSLLLLAPTALTLWLILGQVYQIPWTDSLSEYKDLLIVLASTWLIGVAIGGDQQARERFLRVVLKAELLACVLKLALVAFAALRGIPVSALVNSINLLTGANLMGADFGEASALGRIQFIADGLIPLCLYLLMRYRQRLSIGTVSAFISFILLSVSLVLTFSRYFWAFSAVAVLLGLLFSKRDRYYATLLTGFTLLVIVSLPVLIPIAVFRFSADVAGGSDDVRTLQIRAMNRFFWAAPMLGHGLGSHTNEIIRSDELPYVYEVQLLALTNQIGIVGMLLLAAMLSYFFYALFPWNRPWRGPLLTAQLSTSILLFCWLAAGLFNPILLASSAAVSYGLLKALGEFEEPISTTVAPTPLTI